MNDIHFFSRKGIKRRMAGLFMALPMLAAAPSVSAEVTVIAEADANLRAWVNSDDNYGNADELEVKGSDKLGYARKSIVRFDLSGTSGKTLKNAKLTLTVLKGAFNSPKDKVWRFEVYGLNADANGQEWIEGTGEIDVQGKSPPAAVVWDNAPGNTNTAIGTDPAITTDVGSFSITGVGENGDTVSIAGADLDAFLNTRAGASATFLIVRTTTESDAGGDTSHIVIHKLASRTHGTYDGPTLTYTAAP